MVEVPEYVYEFTIFMIVNGMLWCLANGFDAAIQASGKIRKNQIIYSTLTLIALPISAIFISLWLSTLSTYGDECTYVCYNSYLSMLYHARNIRI